VALRLEDDELIEAFQLGDERVFDTVVAEHRDSLHRHAMRRLNDTAAAEDAVQETFLRAYRSFARLRAESRIAPWLHQIMANVCIDEANRRQRHLSKVERSVDPIITRFVEPGPEERLGLNRPDTSAVEAALHQLPTPYQEALTMRFVDELSYEQMATATGTSEENARARVSRARTAVRSILRGVAVLPVVGAFVFRRSARSAAALDRVGGTETASTATKAATALAPAADTITTVVNTANQTIPLLTKAAIGVGAVSMFAMTTAPERGIEPTVAPIEAAAETTTEATPAPASSPVQAPAAAPIETPAPLAGDTETTLEGALPADTGDLPVATTPAPTGVTTPPETTPDTTVAPVVGLPGRLQVSGLTVTPSGPRVDLVGTASLTVGADVFTGPLNGRLRLEPGAAPTDPRRFEGVLSLTMNGVPVEIRLQGMATPLDAAPATTEPPAVIDPPALPDDDTNANPDTDLVIEGAEWGVGAASATTFSWSGQFRVSGHHSLGLVSGGSFSGGFGPGSLSLVLST
jgi:RNA polymerase sigma-70 factor (ECF subfamily)